MRKICSWWASLPYILKQKLNNSNLSMCSCPHQGCEAFFILKIDNGLWKKGEKGNNELHVLSQIHPFAYNALPTLFNSASKKHHFALGCQLMYGQSLKERWVFPFSLYAQNHFKNEVKITYNAPTEVWRKPRFHDVYWSVWLTAW